MGNAKKNESGLMVRLIAIQGHYLVGFQPPFGGLGFSLPFHIHATTNFFNKKRVKFGFTKVQTHSMLIIKSMHNHSSNLCFVIIHIIL